MIGLVVSHYRVLDRLGAGGMGVVYRAEDLRLGRHVALKFLPESAITDPLAAERFQREARTTSALNHPNICTLHDVGEHEGRRYIVMELIDGATLDKVLGAGALPIDRVIEIAGNIADALDAAHSEAILHRDIKPGNIFITKRGQVKVVDFGLAKMMSRSGLTPVDITIAEQHQLTSAGMAVGTVAYMSPEHARGEAIDQRSDLFSLGVVIYEMATGVQTFKGQTTAVIFDQILNRVPVPPSHINPDVIPALEHIIGRLLEKDRDRRYQSARDVAADLQRLRRDIEARRIVTADAAMSSPPATWAPFENKRSAQTVAVNVPTFGVDADPAPVPAAWATDWDTNRPSSRPGGTPSPIAVPPALPVSAPHATKEPPVSAPVSSPAAAATSGAAPTVMVPASGASRIALSGGMPPAVPPASGPGVPVVPPGPVDAPAVPSLTAFESVAGIAPHAPDAETVLAAARRESAGHGAAADAAEAPMSVPAVWTATAPPPTPPLVRTAAGKPGLGGRGVALVAAAALGLVLSAGGLWYLLQGREVPVASADTPPATPAPVPASTPAPAPVDPAANATVAPPPAPTPGAPARPGAPPVNARITPPATTANGVTPAAATVTPTAPKAPSKAMLQQATVLLSEAQGLLSSGAEADGLAKIAALRASFGGTPPAREGALIAARTHQAARRFDDATTAWIDTAREGVGPEEISEGLIQVADGAARLRNTDGDVAARRTLGEILDRYPASVRALRALQMKMSIEDRMKLKEPDSELNGTAPSSLLTLRRAARAGGTAPVAEFALWRLGQEYRERRLYDLAASTFADLGTRFPDTRYDAWFSAAELFEKQLKDAARAREAYAKVPAASPRYEAAQKKLASA
jgi:serine/threonine protein kinase